MSKYYKKIKTKSVKPIGRSLSYPNHKYSYDMPKHYKNRKGKKYYKYGWLNEELSDYIFKIFELYQFPKRWRKILGYEIKDDIIYHKKMKENKK